MSRAGSSAPPDARKRSEVRLRSLQTVLAAKQAKKRCCADHRTLESELKGGHTMLRELRGADAAVEPSLVGRHGHAHFKFQLFVAENAANR